MASNAGGYPSLVTVTAMRAMVMDMDMDMDMAAMAMAITPVMKRKNRPGNRDGEYRGR